MIDLHSNIKASPYQAEITASQYQSQFIPGWNHSFLISKPVHTRLKLLLPNIKASPYHIPDWNHCFLISKPTHTSRNDCISISKPAHTRLKPLLPNIKVKLAPTTGWNACLPISPDGTTSQFYCVMWHCSDILIFYFIFYFK